MKQMELSPLHWALSSQHSLSKHCFYLQCPWKRDQKKNRKEGRQPYWQNIRKWLWCGRLVSYACYFFPLTDKSIISPRSVPFHSSCIFISFTWILLFYKGASDWKERSYALATDLANMIRWFPSLWNLHQHSLLMEHSKDILIKTNPRN